MARFYIASVTLHNFCISCFHAAVMKHHDQGALLEEEFTWTAAPEVHGEEGWQQATGMAAES